MAVAVPVFIGVPQAPDNLQPLTSTTTGNISMGNTEFTFTLFRDWETWQYFCPNHCRLLGLIVDQICTGTGKVDFPPPTVYIFNSEKQRFLILFFFTKKRTVFFVNLFSLTQKNSIFSNECNMFVYLLNYKYKSNHSDLELYTIFINNVVNSIIFIVKTKTDFLQGYLQVGKRS